MGWLIQFTKSSIGSKALMALTGAGMLGFTIAHFLGNSLIFVGPDALNEYARTLHHTPTLLWVARLGTLAMITIHVGVAFRLWSANRAARPERYVYQNTIKATPASRGMIYSGLLLLTFVVYHLLHFTLGVVNPADSFAPNNLVPVAGEVGQQMPDVFSMVVKSFSNPLVSLSYIVAMVTLGAHLVHGIASLFQTLGLNTPKTKPLSVQLGWGLTIFLVGGNIAIPVSILLGIVGH
jgi:succinate dehydrogenase / fumarate reductase cytochrome b subunit